LIPAHHQAFALGTHFPAPVGHDVQFQRWTLQMTSFAAQSKASGSLTRRERESQMQPRSADAGSGRTNRRTRDIGLRDGRMRTSLERLSRGSVTAAIACWGRTGCTHPYQFLLIDDPSARPQPRVPAPSAELGFGNGMPCELTPAITALAGRLLGFGWVEIQERNWVMAST
jgi:hypothetical protein